MFPPRPFAAPPELDPDTVSGRRRLILLLTHRDDFDVTDRVQAALARRARQSLRLDLDRYPHEWSLSQRLGGNADGARLIVGDSALDASQLTAVWVRHWCPPALDDRLDPAFRDGCLRNATLAARGFFETLAHVHWLSHPARIRDAENKIRQLRTAQRSGLTIPRTLVTNHAPDARAFFDELGGEMVAKMLTNLSSSMGRAPFFVRTRRVTPAHLERLDDLRHSPMIFQELVAKQSELRVAWVDGRVFVGRIDVPGLVDWRTASPDDACWQHDSLPDATTAALGTLMRSLDLRYGAIDLIRTPAGELVFLEVNPTGEWGMLERDLHLPISDALADALIAGAQP